jgi:hypothetical protein
MRNVSANFLATIYIYVEYEIDSEGNDSDMTHVVKVIKKLPFINRKDVFA